MSVPLALGVLLSCAALAAPPPDDTRMAEPADSSALQLVTERLRRVGPDGAQVVVDDLSLSIRSGWVVPIAARVHGGPLDTLGFVWIGDGQLTLRLPDRADAITLANRLVRELGYANEDVRELATREVLTTSADLALVLASPGQVAEWAFLEEEPAPTDPYEVVVYADRGGEEVVRRARRTFDRRMTLYRELGLDLVDELVRAPRSPDGEGAKVRRTLVDVHTSQRFGIASTFTGPLAADDAWIAVVRDDTGTFDPRRRSQLVSMGRNEGGIARSGRVGGRPFAPIDPADPRSAPAPSVRLQPERASVRIEAEPARHGQALLVTVEAELRLGAVGGPLRRGAFELPATRREDARWHLVELATPDGAPIPFQPRGSRITFELPEPVPQGESLTLHLTTRGAFELGRRPLCDKLESFGSSAPTTEPLHFLPAVGRWATGDTWQVELEVVTRPQDGLVVLAGGDASAHSLRQPEIVFGRWKMHRAEPAHPKAPPVTAYGHRLHPTLIEELPPEVRRIYSFYSGWLPERPAERLEAAELHPLCLKHVPTPIPLDCDLYEAPAGCGQRLQLPGPGSIPLRQWMGGDRCFDLTDDVPYLRNGMLAHDAAHQYWGQLARPAHDEDHWIVESLAEVYSCLYVAAAFGADACDARMKRARVRFEGVERSGAALSGAYADEHWDDRVWLYGPYVLLHMLRPRIGSDRFFAALDVLLLEHPHEPLTTERLQHYFELASGRDLTDFFDFWIHQGLIPALRLDWSVDEDGLVHGTLTSDLPFGRFDVPVRVRTRQGETWVQVDVVDGVGSFSVRAPGRRPRVDLDPHHLVLARRRAVGRLRVPDGPLRSPLLEVRPHPP